jgi:hypothetical protein
VSRDQAQPSREVPGRRRRPHNALALGDEDTVGTIAIDFHHSPAGLLRCFSNLREESTRESRMVGPVVRKPKWLSYPILPKAVMRRRYH